MCIRDSGRGGRTRTYRDKDGHTHTTTDWYPVRGSVGQFFNDLQVCASEKSNSKYLNDVLPYDTVNDIKPYSPQYISGFQAEKYAWRGDACFRLAERMIKDALEAQARDSILSLIHISSSDPLPRGYRKQRFLCRLYTFPTAHKYEEADPWESLQSIA